MGRREDMLEVVNTTKKDEMISQVCKALREFYQETGVEVRSLELDYSYKDSDDPYVYVTKLKME